MEEKIMTEQKNNSKVRAIIFAVATAVLFLLWGGRVYADNMIEQGKSGELTIKINPSDAPDELEEPGNYRILKADTGEVINGVTIKHKSHIDGSMPEGRDTQVTLQIDIPADMTVGSYKVDVKYQGRMWDWEMDLLNNEFRVIEAVTTSDKNKNRADTGALGLAYAPLTPEEQYLQTLDEWYPSGYRFMKTGEIESFHYLSNDSKTCSIWKNGVHIADFSFATGDGEIRRMLLQNPVTVDGVSYPSVWVNVNDGQEVLLQITDEERQALIDMGITGIYLNEKLILL